jgi:segregation and condensation protein A
MNPVTTPSRQESLILQDRSLGPGISLRLPIFEGPMDLLLYLIRREEVDIFNIPIALITREYLNSLELMRAHDLDVGGEFLMMAATLLSIKAKMLLPRPVQGEGGEEGDPRRELVERILEYRAYKETAELFRNLEAKQSDLFPRGIVAEVEEEDSAEFLRDVTLFDLLLAFKRAMDRLQAEKADYRVFLFPETLDQRIAMLREKLLNQKKIAFSSLIEELDTRLAVIMTFLAILEMTRCGEIALKGVGDADFYLLSRVA